MVSIVERRWIYRAADNCGLIPTYRAARLAEDDLLRVEGGRGRAAGSRWSPLFLC
jgi:hypothetical protein